MAKFRFTLKTLVLTAFVLSFASLAQAQSTRTWVSGVGDDINPCSRTAPCKTYGGAISKTAINGEINALDPGGFGALTTTKSITVDGTGQLTGQLSSSVTAINISLGAANANDPLRTVRIKNLSMNGTGLSGTVGTRTGIRGVSVNTTNTAPVNVFLDGLFIHGFVNEGVLFNAAGGNLSVENCKIIDNGGSGIRTLSTSSAATGIIHVTIANSRVDLNQQGIRFEGNSFGVVKNTTASNNTLNGFVVNPVSIGGAEMNIVDSTANNNKQFGIFAGGTGFTGTIRLMGNVAALHNTTNQLQINAGGQICTNQKNHIGTPSAAPSCNFLDQ